MTGDARAFVSKSGDDGPGFSFGHYPAAIPTALRFYDTCKTGALKPYDLFTMINSDPVLTGITYGLYHEFFPEIPQIFFGLTQIIIKLNINTVKNHVLKALERAIPPEKAGKGIVDKQADFLRRSLAAGMVSLLLAKRRGLAVRDIQKYYCAGLLHDIGGFVLLEGSGAGFDGLTPEKAGLLAAKLWGFPSVIHDVIAFHRNHRRYTGEHADVVCHTALSVSILDKWEAAKSSEESLSQASATDKLFKLLNLDKGILEGIEESFRAEFKKTAAFIGLGD
ncbi:MAG: HDOD domain-containing protein [Spirochaetaceae bacterium]|jgi:HD-like signal output (HDOD) protein|nr:HDOD domain-containing protein [Spirochaetaceae bacterium]